MKKKYCRRSKKVIALLLYVAGIGFSAFEFGLIVSKNKDDVIKKYKSYFYLMLEWMTILENGKLISDYLDEKGYTRIAVYGGRDMGEHLVKQIVERDISVAYIIDRSLSRFKYDIPIYTLEDQLPMVDAIIVTPIWDYDNIKTKLSAKVSCPIIPMDNLIVRDADE